jgi:hypothetical protein
MKATYIKMVPKESYEGRQRNVVEMLEWLKEEGFESIIIHGFKDGIIYTHASASKSALELLGALDAAKCEVWDRG